ncbi:MAG: hypothetical protein ACE5JB_09455 [bacterium]
MKNECPQKIMNVMLMTVLILCLFVSFTLPCLAQEKNHPPQVNTDQDDQDFEKKKESIKLLLDKIEILGHIEKPQTMFIIPGTDPTVDDIQIDRSFFKEIFRSIEKDDFPRNIEKLGRQHILW